MTARWIGLMAGAALLLIFALTCRPQSAGISISPINWMAAPQTLTGTAPPLSEINVRVNGDLAGQTQADANGRWSIRMPRDLSQAEVSVEARTARGAVASAMMRSPEAEPDQRQFAARRYPSEFAGAPLVSITQPSAGSPQPMAGQLRVSGSGRPGTTVNILADGILLGEAEVGPEGDWQGEFSLAKPAERLTAELSGAVAEVVWRPAKAEAPSAPSASPPPPLDLHVIEAGQTLSEISALYNIKLSRLCQLNKISNPDLIFAGAALRLR